MQLICLPYRKSKFVSIAKGRVTTPEKNCTPSCLQKWIFGLSNWCWRASPCDQESGSSVVCSLSYQYIIIEVVPWPPFLLWEVLAKPVSPAHPLYQLLKKVFSLARNWSAKEEAAFQKSKKLLLSSSILVHFDSDIDLIVACDASAYGVGAVLSHRMSDGSERPIAFASCSLSESEKKYS